VFACDSSKSKRKKIYPKYKENRKEKTEEQIKLDSIAFPQFDALKNDVLPKIGYKNIFEVKGLEADDIISRICLDYSDDEIKIVTRDNDIWQCITKNVSIMDPKTHNLLTEFKFKQQYGISPKQWKKVKQLAGCKGDNVEGIQGVGNPTAIKYLKGELKKVTAKGEPTKVYKRIKEGKKLIKFNKKLVVLPFKNTPHFTLKPDHLNASKFKLICKKYNFKSILSMIDEWNSALKLF
jgi:5'-3' exonuclease